MTQFDVQIVVATAPAPGAVGLIQLHGVDAAKVVELLTNRRPTQRASLCNLGEIDEGLVASPTRDYCLLMPHGGLRVMQRVVGVLIDLGARPPHTAIDSRTLFPEARTPLEADWLEALSRVPSPMALSRLIRQPSLWTAVAESNDIDVRRMSDVADCLRTLMEPPTIVLVGPPNVGKSALTNRILGHDEQLTSPTAGTTRDWVAASAALIGSEGAFAVRWIDTPGSQTSDDPIEQEAIRLAHDAVVEADLILAVRDLETAFSPLPSGREADLRIVNKVDLAPGEVEMDDMDALHTSALTGEGLDGLGEAVAKAMGWPDVSLDEPWAFSRRLRDLIGADDRSLLRRYILG